MIENWKEKLPEKLTSHREIMEGNFVFSLWKNPEFFDIYKIDPHTDLLTHDAKFYYILGRDMFNKGYNTFDDLAVKTYLSNQESLLHEYEKKGGYPEIKVILERINLENAETYYDNLCRDNMLIEFYTSTNLLENIDKLKQMTANEFYDWVDFHLNKSALAKMTDVEIEELTIDQEFLMECDSGEDIGLHYGKIAKILNYITLGIPKSNLYLVGAHSGVGKTSWVLANMVVPVLEQDHKVCIISNEQKSNEFKRLLLAMALADEIGYYKITRKKLKQGNFSKEQWDKLEEAGKALNTKLKDKLKFVKMYDYNINKVKKIVKKLSKQGYELFIYDTMKAEDASQNKLYGVLVENSKELFQLASKEDIAIVVSYQLALHTLNKRYLDETCLSNSKQIKEVFSEMVYFRELWEDEYDDGKYDVKPYTHQKDENGKWSKVPLPKNKNGFVLDPDKKYYVFFVNKTRNDEAGQTLLYQWDSAWNKWRELGFCQVHRDRGY